MNLKNEFLTILLFAGALVVTGCSAGSELSSGSSDRRTRVAMNVLSIMYGEYLESHRGIPPANIDAFRSYLESNPETLKRYQVEALDQLLNSPRDGQPLVIVCGERVAPRESPGTPWAAYEQTGVDGTRMAVRVRGGVYELSDEEINRTFANP